MISNKAINDKHIKNGWTFKRADVNKSKSIIIARDINYNGEKRSMFYGIDNYDELLELTLEDSNLYEVSTTTNDTNITERRIYADIDEFKTKPITKKEADIVINDFIDAVNEEIKDNDIKINIDDVVVLVNNDYKTELIKSLHLIVNGYSMDYLQQKEMIKTMNYKNKKYDRLYDEAIYSKNQQFRLINQSKISIDGSKKYNLIFYGLSSKNKIKNTLINNTAKTKSIKYKKTLIKSIKDENKTNNKIEIKLTLKTFIKSLDYLDDKFYNSSSNWKQATRIIKKFNLIDMTRWERITRQKATRDYLKDNNDDFILGIDVLKVKSGITNIIKVFNESSTNYYFVIEYDVWETAKDKLTTYIKTNNLTIDFKTMKEIIKNKTLRLYDDRYDINLKTGMITDKINLTTHNFMTTKTETEDLFKTETIEHISEIKVDDFIDGDDKFLNIKSDWGTGKSHYILKPIIEKQHDEKSILIITPLNSINNKNYDDLKKYGFVSHLTITKNDNIKNHNLVICSIQSLYKLENKKFDYIFLDEFESIMNAYAGDNFERVSPLDSYLCFLNMCKKSQKIICLDADLDHNRLKLLTDAIGYNSDEIKVYHNKQNEYIDYTYEIIQNKDELTNDITKRIIENKKCVISTASKKYGDVLYETLKKDFPLKNISYISVDGVKLSNGDDVDKDEYIQNLEHNLKDIDVWIYTPTISVGISINEMLFDYGFAYAHQLSLNALQFLQQLFRARKLTTKHITICLEKCGWCDAGSITYEQMKYHIKNKTDLYIEFNTEHLKANYISNELYTNMFCYAKMIDENSKMSYGSQLINLLENHNLNYVYRCDENKKNKLISSYIETIEEIENQKIEDFNDAELLNIKEFIIIKKKLKNNDTLKDVDDDEKKRFKKTNAIYHLNNIFQFVNKIDVNDENILLDVNNYIQSHILESNNYYDASKQVGEILEIRKTFNLYNSIKLNSLNINDVIIDDDDNDDLIIDNGNKIKTDGIIFLRLIMIMKYNLATLTITNKDFKNLLVEHKDTIKLVYSLYSAKYNKNENNDFIMWIDGYDITSKTTTDKKNIKNIYHIVKDIFNKYDINISYKDRVNTTKDADKIIITTKNELVNYGTKPLIKSRIINELEGDYVMDNFNINNNFNADLSSGIITSKEYGRTKRMRYYNNNKKEMFLYGDKYRPYEIKINKKTSELMERIQEPLKYDFIENIKDINNAIKLNPKQDDNYYDFITDITTDTRKEWGLNLQDEPLEIIDVVDDEDDYDDEDDGVGLIKKIETRTYYEKCGEHIEDIEKERENKRKKTLAYLE